jgi:glycosyltransferase involved in cell wall biosynthesis
VVFRERARAATSADVRVLGFVNQLDLPRVYAAADVFVLPSLKDPRATVVNEAMASGLPPIVSEGTGVWGVGDLVRHGQEGYVVPVGGIEPLVDACRRLIDPSTRAAMAQASRSRVELWSYETAVDGWRAALATCLGASRAA